jgi:hypothetical protein
VNVEYEMLCHTIITVATGAITNMTKKIISKQYEEALNRFCTKKNVMLGTLHIIRKVLKSEP